MTRSQSSTPTNRSGNRPQRVVHLVDGPDRDGSSPISGPLQEFLRERPDDLVVTVGGTRAYGTMARLVPARRRLMGIGDGGLAKLLRRISENGEVVDVVHAWGMRGTALLGASSPGLVAVASLDGFRANAPEALAAATVIRTGRVESLFGSHMAQRLASSLVGSDARRSGRERVGCPVVDPDRLEGRRDDLRHRWGARPDSLVVGIVGSPMDQLDLRDQSGLPVRCSLLGRHVVMVVSSRGARRGDLVRWMERAGPQVHLVFDDIVERTGEIAMSLDLAVAPAAVGRQTQVCDVAPVMTVLAGGKPVVLGSRHPAAEHADREELLRAGGVHDEHESTRWLVDRLGAGDGEAGRERARRRFDGYRKALNELYARAASAAGHSWSGASSSMAAS